MTATIKDIMSTAPTFLSATSTIQQAAQKMAELDCGFIPVGEGTKLVGIVTDRDIAVRAVAKGLTPTSPLSGIMTSNVWYCCETDSIESVAQNMSTQQVRRLIVLNDKTDKKLVGVVSVGDIACASKTTATTTSSLLQGVSQPTSTTKAAAA